MNREDVARMAREAGINVTEGNSFSDDMYISVLYRFANIVTAVEREACAEVCDAYGMPDGTSETARVLAVCIRARTLHELNRAAQQNGEEL